MQDRPNVLLLMSDQHSFRYLGAEERPTGHGVETPAMDGLARSGAWFRTAYAGAPTCTPSRISMLTGRRVPDCGGWHNSSYLRPELETFPGAFSAVGYDTCLQGKMHLGGNQQFAGFDRRPYGDLTGVGGVQADPLTESRRAGLFPPESRIKDVGVTEIPESQRQERIVTAESVEYLREHAATDDAPWLLCASFQRPHFPYTAPRRHVRRYWDLAADEPTEAFEAPLVGRAGDTSDHPMTCRVHEQRRLGEFDDHDIMRARACYMACVDYLDEVIGDFLGTLEADGFLQDTIVVYLSDHGELAGEHGLFGKKPWHEAGVRVPLMIETPTHRASDDAGPTVDEPVSLLDLFPTLCGLCDVATPSDLAGTDLSRTVREAAALDRGPVVCDHMEFPPDADTAFAVGEYRLVRDDRYKYVRFNDMPDVLVDLAEDPLEQRNLLEDGVGGVDAPARERPGGISAATWDMLHVDFDAIHQQRQVDEQRLDEAALPDTGRSGNKYLFPDGRIIEAENLLYDPEILTGDPAAFFADWPGDRGRSLKNDRRIDDRQ